MLQSLARTLALSGAALASAGLVNAQANGAVSFTPAATTDQASNLSPILTPAFAGMGIEPSNLFAFTGTTTPNQLTLNLLNNLANYTGVPAPIRVGGNTGDNMIYRASVRGYRLATNPNPVGTGHVPTDQYLIGPNYFNAFDNLPAGTPITYGVNLAYQGSDRFDVMVAQAQAAFSNVKKVKIVGLEVGNEPDLYSQLGYRDGSYGGTAYGSEWAQGATAIYNQVLKPMGIASNFFEPAATATTATKNGHQYRINQLVDTGVATLNGALVAGWNQHDYYYYIGVSNFQITIDYLLDLSNTVYQFGEWSQQVQQALQTGKPYYLREMGSIGPTGIKGISDTFANTLWTFNFFLYAASVGVSVVQMHMTLDSYGAPWQPIEINGEQPHVRSSFYAWAAIQQIIGKDCSTRVASLDVNSPPSGYKNRISAYAIYNGTNIRGFAILNTKPFAQGSGSRGAIDYNFKIPALAGQTIFLSALTAAGSDATDNTVWNGLSYEQNGDGTSSTVDSTTYATTIGSDGSVTVTIQDSQAVVGNAGSRLGNTRGQQRAQNCDIVAATFPSGTGSSGTGTAAGASPTFRFKNAAGPAVSPRSSSTLHASAFALAVVLASTAIFLA